ncbi:MAG: hypothetical protein OXE41_04885 [Gammaproteobacteria bacterium]|nr:hypothetical protein [Gammaproteobacteria bacterium]MCY4218784.1 hypothetical protein [Gammaproteobacteria bacterium]MCY4274717.1 hypothetical protein [Gammaproteobacteria bacterium]
MTRIIVFFVVAIAAFVAGAYYSQTESDFAHIAVQVQELQNQNVSLRTENAALQSQVDLIKKALQTNIAAMARIQRNPGDAASSAGELRLIAEEQRKLLNQSQTE